MRYRWRCRVCGSRSPARKSADLDECERCACSNWRRVRVRKAKRAAEPETEPEAEPEPEGDAMPMTAEDARKLTAEARQPDNVQVVIVINAWHDAIGRAARKGRDCVRETEMIIGRVGTITDSSRGAALAQLGREGYVTRVVQDDRAGETIEVAW